MSKKVSLFKQKMQEKQEKSQVTGSFPIADKIDIHIEDKNHQTESNKIQQQTQPTILQEMSKLFPQNQMQQIQTENSKLIDSLTPQQIRQYQQMIFNQMPKEFLQKLHKKQNQHPLKTGKVQKKIKIQSLEKMEQEHMTNIGSNQHQKMVAEQTIQQEIKQKLANMTINEQPNAKQQTDEEFISELFVNPQTAILKISNQQQNTSSQLLTLSNLRMLILSDNNQSQIIGSDIFFNMLTIITNKKQSIIDIGTVRYVKWKFIRSLWKFFYPCLQKVILETKFKSCWILVLKGLTQIIQKISKYLTLEEKKNVLGVISNTYTLRQTEIVQAKIQPVINSAIQILSNQQEQQQIIDMQNKQNIENIIQLIILQQYTFSKKTSKWNYLSHLFYALKKCTNLSIAIDYFFVLLLELQLYFQKASSLQLKQAQTDKFVKNHLKELFILRFGKLQADQHTDNQLYFKHLYIVKELDQDIFQEYVEKFNQGNQKNFNKIMLVTFLSLKHYQQGEISTQELNNINLIFQNILTVLPTIPPWWILNSLLILYQNPTGPYNQQSICKNMDKCMQSIINKCSKKQLQNLFDIERVKSLIQKYNFSSFGSHSFTKLMFIIGLLNDQYEKVITEQVYYRYPFLFYYVFQQDSPYLFAGLHPQQYIKDEKTLEKQDIAEMFVKDAKLNKKNLFYRYLICDL